MTMLNGLVLLVVFWSGYVQAYHHKSQQPPRITEHPVDTTVARHEPATLNCHASGEPEPVITWFKDGAALRSAPHRMLLPAGNLFFLRVVQSRKESDGGVYWCEATNPLGKARSRNATLIVAILRDEFRLEPQSTRVASGEDTVLECAPPKGTPEPQITWRKDGQTIEIQGRYKLVDGSNLAITDTKIADDGRYQCIAKNVAGTRESSVAVLKVFVKPYMIRPPEDVKALVGATVDFSCAVGGDPLPGVLWRRNAVGGTIPLDRIRVVEDGVLRLEHVTVSDQGTYICEADNFAGSVTASAVLTVHSVPTFTARPLAQTVEAGQEVSFQCNAEGSPRPFIFWSFEGDRVLVYPGNPSGNFEAFTSIEGHSTLMLKNAQLLNSGTVIICSAINEAGSVSTRTRLTITSKEDRPPPIILRGPSNQTLPVNSIASLICEATGNPKPVISWYKEGVPVSNSPRINMSNPSLIQIRDLQRDDSGMYTCVVSSKGGKATWTGHLLVENPKNPNINFFKSPEAVMLPGPPSRPHALNQSEGSVTITWGQNNKIGSSSLLGYQVEIFGRESGMIPTWTVVARRVPGPTFTQHLLTPGVPYTFIIRAENGHGLGPPSQMSEPIIVGPDSNTNWGNPEVTVLSEARASLIHSKIVELNDVTPISSTVVKLSWEILDAEYVEGLYIYYVSMEDNPNVPKTYSMLTVLHSGGSSSFTVNNLEKWEKYQFFLVPFFKTVEGQPSNSKTVRTLEDVPADPPEHMEAILLNSSAVYLKWKSPASESIHGELEGYKVEIKANGSEAVENIDVGTNPTLLLGNLTAGISYHVRVAASTRAGIGPFTPSATLRLDPASRVTDNQHQRPMGTDYHPGDFLTETWFLALLICLITVMLLLFAAMLFVRRRQMLLEKTMTPSRSNGGVLSTPMAHKQDTPLWLDKNLPEYTSTLPDYSKLNQHTYDAQNGVVAQCNGAYHGINLHHNPLHATDYSRPDRLEYKPENGYPLTAQFKDFNSMQVQEYASPNVDSNRTSQNAEYAEVDPNVGAHTSSGTTSPAPYATTTLVTGGRRVGNSLNWSPHMSSSSTSEESPYPAANGGYYNRKVYSDSYFAPTQTLRRSKKERKNSSENPPDLVSPSQPVYARVGPPGLSWKNAAPYLTSFTPHKQVYHASTRSEPGDNML
ncbi:roundabout homolog 1-like isoform X2 [Harmonia axyridis]|uniref:roundabout homolog 1-like isoform X2 n=1 Tax=Harmonia axyridis TaxID=115357 RepID=UPI001E277EAB|nr:roundabout homolog 1-like isoform X2 [Harmonia axyridis]